LAVRLLRILRLPGLAAAIDGDGVAGLQLHATLGEDVVQLPAVDRTVLGDELGAAMSRDVEQDAAGDDAVLPVLDGAEARAVEADLLLGVTAVPHGVVVPGVAERVDVGGGDAVIEDA